MTSIWERAYQAVLEDFPALLKWDALMRLFDARDDVLAAHEMLGKAADEASAALGQLNEFDGIVDDELAED